MSKAQVFFKAAEIVCKDDTAPYNYILLSWSISTTMLTVWKCDKQLTRKLVSIIPHYLTSLAAGIDIIYSSCHRWSQFESSEAVVQKCHYCRQILLVQLPAVPECNCWASALCEMDNNYIYNIRMSDKETHLSSRNEVTLRATSMAYKEHSLFPCVRSAYYKLNQQWRYHFYWSCVKKG